MQQNPSTSHRGRTIFGAVTLVLAIALIVVLVTASGSKDSGGKGSVQKSSIWKPGTTWTIKVQQDSSIASPDSDHAVTYDQAYDFHLATAPTSPDGYWRVDAKLSGAQGPFADGFRLYYVKDGDAFVLKKVAVGKQAPLAVKFAPTLLGQAFPLQKRITQTPTDQKLVAKNGGTGAAS